MNESLLDQSDSFDETKDYHADLVGEGKKFKDDAALAKGKAYSDYHITLIERQNKELRDQLTQYQGEVAKAKTLEDLVTELEKRQSSVQNNQPDIQDKPSLKPEDVETLIDRRMTERERARKEQENFNYVKGKLVERYGDRYQDVLSKQASELELDNVDEMARRRPKVLIKALGLDDQPRQDNFQNLPRSGQRDLFTPTGAKKKTWSYYQDLKKQSKDPNILFTPQMTKEMNESAMALGDAFYDGDFNDSRYQDRALR